MGCDLIIDEAQEYTDISIHAPIVGCDYYTDHRVRVYDKFQSTHPSWGATFKLKYIEALNEISIHAPIVGCDNRGHINIWHRIQFQSTHPSWGATEHGRLVAVPTLDFNPRTHRGVRLQK